MCVCVSVRACVLACVCECVCMCLCVLARFKLSSQFESAKRGDKGSSELKVIIELKELEELEELEEVQLEDSPKETLAGVLERYLLTKVINTNTRFWLPCISYNHYHDI